ncbi:hypothetical protein F0919_08600 [Taibaiella lutea]|uniref:Outer membrane protein beta-barrel domain-containing protein n=1 Tax=Taibaiella lutea TaxID=2608001 RepID=A0A5M6CHM5_9BACT|nr:hypothetical protein [Taibaiella lutea]KAA5534664.1 hypothetical protein F0919_08600 [Taibaiella lutea]
MNRIISLSFLLLLLPLRFFAQSNYKPATVILLNHQQLVGYINYKEWDSNPKSFSFKDDKGQQTLGIQDVESFTINKLETFERFIFTTKTSGKAKSISDIKIGNQKPLTDTIFIRLVTSGKFLNLYVYENKYCTKFFIKDNYKQQTSELIYDEFYPDGTMFNIEYNNKYKGQLSIFAHDSMANNQNKVMRLLERATYSYDALTKIVNLLNAENATKTNTKFEMKPFAGLFLQRSDASYSEKTPLADAPRTPSYRPGINAGLDFYTNAVIRRYMMRMEVSVSSSSFETKKTNEVSPKESHVYYHKFDQYKISFAPQFLMNIYNKDRFKFNIGVGICFDYSFFTNDDCYAINTYYGISHELKTPFEYQHFSLSAPIRAGIILNKKIDIFGKYNLPVSNNSNYLAYSLTIRSLQIGVNYLF